MGVQAIEQPAVLGWYPTGSERLNSSGATANDDSNDDAVQVRINAKYMIPQCFSETSALADPCICRCSLPDWVSPKNEHDALFPEAPQGLTPSLVLVRVTPEVWAWSAFVRLAVEARGSVSKLLKFQSEALYEYIPYVCRKLYAETELDEAKQVAKRRVDAGCPLAELLLEPDDAFLGFVKFGGCEPWDGYEKWAARRRSAAMSTSSATAPEPAFADVSAKAATGRARANRQTRTVETPSLI